MIGGCMFWKKSCWILLLGGLLITYGCAANSMMPFGNAQKDEVTIVPPDRVIGTLSAQPEHVKFVIAGMINKMRGDRDRIPEVQFDPEGKHILYDTDFTYDDFDVRAIEITGFELKRRTDDQARMVIEGVFHFIDLFGRSSTNYFAADYSVQKNGVVIRNSGTVLIAPAIPDVETYYVPKASFEGQDLKTMTSFMDLYLHAVLNGIQMEPSQEERQNKAAYDQLSAFSKMTSSGSEEPDDLFIMVFCKDRLPSESSLEMRITDMPGERGNSRLNPGYVYDEGWRIAIAGGVFCPHKLKNDLFIRLEYNTAPQTKRQSIVIAEYTNQKNYTDHSQYRIALKTDADGTTSQSSAGPLEAGLRFLNPAKKEDAKLIQTRLATMGYYQHAVDGLFGKGSREALREYRNDNGLGDEAVWDLATQKKLFTNSGL